MDYKKNLELKNKIILVAFLLSIVLRVVFDIILNVELKFMLILVMVSIPLALVDLMLIKKKYTNLLWYYNNKCISRFSGSNNRSNMQYRNCTLFLFKL
ncbi:MAG: hypothetical protein ABF652_11310 [Clostridium beijerinckii]